MHVLLARDDGHLLNDYTDIDIAVIVNAYANSRSSVISIRIAAKRGYMGSIKMHAHLPLLSI